MIAIRPEDQEWYTPDNILNKVYQTLEFVDLDPCSNSLTCPNVIANRYYTKDDNGLNLSWNAKTVFVNPPYGRVLSKWVKKMIFEWEKESFLSALILIPAKTDTKYWHDLYNISAFTCLIRGRLKFKSIEGDIPCQFGTFGSSIMLITNDDSCKIRFLDAFDSMGIVF